MPEPRRRILVTGSRHARDRTVIKRGIRSVPDVAWSTEILWVHGDCPTGADAIAHQLLLGMGFEDGKDIERHPAENFGAWPAAGPRRNTHMVLLGAELVIAFPCPRSSGTWDLVKKAAKANIPIRIYPVNGHRA